MSRRGRCRWIGWGMLDGHQLLMEGSELLGSGLLVLLLLLLQLLKERGNVKIHRMQMKGQDETGVETTVRSVSCRCKGKGDEGRETRDERQGTRLRVEEVNKRSRQSWSIETS